MIVFSCQFCQTSLSAQESQVGQLVCCPSCRQAIRVPAAAPQPVPVAAAPATTTPQPSLQAIAASARGTGSWRARFSFNCGYCSSRLEGSQATAGSEGQCPTCGNQITVPIMDNHGRLIDPHTREIIRQDPHPVHTYAADGARAPKIIRRDDGTQVIRCPRCHVRSPVSANNCQSCGLPFTMEGTNSDAALSNNGFCVAALVLGILSIPTAIYVVTPLLAIGCAIAGMTQTRDNPQQGGRALAIAGLFCGMIGMLIMIWSVLH